MTAGPTTDLIRATARRLPDVRLDEIVDRTVQRTIDEEPTYTDAALMATRRHGVASRRHR
jgi:hypothetical protein